MDRSEAQAEVLRHINAGYGEPEDSLIILEDSTIEKPYGWIFFYQSRTYLETGDASYMLAGNGPVVFVGDDRSIHRLGTALPVAEEIERFEHDLLGRS